MKKVTKKLQLNKTTISSLNNQQLSQLGGGLLAFQTFDTWCDMPGTFGDGPGGTGGTFGGGSGGTLGCPSPNPIPTISCITCDPANQSCMQGATHCGLQNTCSCESRCLCVISIQNTGCQACPPVPSVNAACPSAGCNCTFSPSGCI